MPDRFIYSIHLEAVTSGSDPDAEIGATEERRGNCPMIAEVIGSRLAMDFARVVQNIRDDLPGYQPEAIKALQQVIAEAWDENGEPNGKWI